MRITWSEVPEYVVALERENVQRDCAFFLDRESISGLDVLPFTPRHLIILDSIGSPFLRGGMPSEVEVARFLWAVSPGFAEGQRGEKGNSLLCPFPPLLLFGSCRTRFLRRCRKLPYAATVLAIHNYLDEAFADSPGGDGQAGAPSDFSLAACLVHQIASEYGWSEDVILNTPFKRLWQYLRCIRRQANPDAVFINSLTQRAQRLHMEKLTTNN